MTEEQIRCVKDGLSRQKLYITLGCIEELEKENEKLKARVSYLEDNLRVARKDRERLQDDVANGLEEFIKEKPATSLHLLANKEVKEENEKLKQQNAKMKCCYLCKSVYNCAFADVFNFHCCNKWELTE